MNITQELVNENLNAALENHYDDLLTWPPRDVAFDLMAYSDDFCNVERPEEIMPFVEFWQITQKAK